MKFVWFLAFTLQLVFCDIFSDQTSIPIKSMVTQLFSKHMFGMESENVNKLFGHKHEKPLTVVFNDFLDMVFKTEKYY
mgnify:CR=1 FL=1